MGILLKEQIHKANLLIPIGAGLTKESRFAKLNEVKYS